MLFFFIYSSFSYSLQFNNLSNRNQIFLPFGLRDQPAFSSVHLHPAHGHHRCHTWQTGPQSHHQHNHGWGKYRECHYKLGNNIINNWHLLQMTLPTSNPELYTLTTRPPCTQSHLSYLVGKPTMWFPTRSDTNQAVQAQKQARC